MKGLHGSPRAPWISGLTDLPTYVSDMPLSIVPSVQMYGVTVTAAEAAAWPHAAAPLPSPEAVDPAHIRWHYKSDSDKRWTPFDGFDSLTLEQHYRHLYPAPGVSSATYTAEAAGDGEATDVSQLLGGGGRQGAYSDAPATCPGAVYPHYDSVAAASYNGAGAAYNGAGAAYNGAGAAYNGAGPQASPSHVRLQHAGAAPHVINGETAVNRWWMTLGNGGR